jgi:4-hydroxy-tetrahydrodipicolinate reductase
MTLRICVAGATGWVGRSLVTAIGAANDLQLVGAVARRRAGEDAGIAVGGTPIGLALAPSVVAALAVPTDVLIDFTKPDAVKAHALTAIAQRVGVVVGTSGLTAADYAEIDDAAKAAGVGVIAAGNFSITAALLQHFALLAARHLPQWEIIDYASAGKIGAPSGTARELAERMAAVKKPAIGRPLDQIHGAREARGASIDGVQVHSLRLPGFVLSCEALFGLSDERLTIRHDAGSSAAPYIAGTLIAARRVGQIKGLVRGLDTLLFGGVSN